MEYEAICPKFNEKLTKIFFSNLKKLLKWPKINLKKIRGLTLKNQVAIMSTTKAMERREKTFVLFLGMQWSIERSGLHFFNKIKERDGMDGKYFFKD